jgi:hypothetical protein
VADKTPKRVVRVKLPLELIEALEEMGRATVAAGIIPAPRTLHNMIECSLQYAVWKYGKGTGPDAEMLPSRNDNRGYLKWNEKMRRSPYAERSAEAPAQARKRLRESPEQADVERLASLSVLSKLVH